MNTALYWPMLAMIVWTMGVGLFAVSRRVREIRAKRIPLRMMARSRDISSVLDDTQAMDNFNNLLQVPTLFYVWCLASIMLQMHEWLMLVGAWLYVGLRFWHTGIQITHNRVLQRFRVWMASNIMLLAIWLGSAMHLVGQSFH
jgi:hypothetical protein